MENFFMIVYMSLTPRTGDGEKFVRVALKDLGRKVGAGSSHTRTSYWWLGDTMTRILVQDKLEQAMRMGGPMKSTLII